MPLISRPKAMFFSTVIQGNRAYSWNTTPRSGPGPVTALPSAVMLPLVGSEKPATALSRVDLPQPEGPSRQTNWPASISRLMSLSATTSRSWLVKILLTPDTTIWDWAISALQAAVPPQQIVIQFVHADIERQADHADRKHAGHHLVGPRIFARFVDAEPQAVRHRDQFRDDHDHERRAERNAETRQDIRRGG